MRSKRTIDSAMLPVVTAFSSQPVLAKKFMENPTPLSIGRWHPHSAIIKIRTRGLAAATRCRKGKKGSSLRRPKRHKGDGARSRGCHTSSRQRAAATRVRHIHDRGRAHDYQRRSACYRSRQRPPDCCSHGQGDPSGYRFRAAACSDGLRGEARQAARSQAIESG